MKRFGACAGGGIVSDKSRVDRKVEIPMSRVMAWVETKICEGVKFGNSYPVHEFHFDLLDDMARHFIDKGGLRECKGLCASDVAGFDVVENPAEPGRMILRIGLY